MNKKPAESLRHSVPCCYNCKHHTLFTDVEVVDAVSPFGQKRTVYSCLQHDFTFEYEDEAKRLVCDSHEPRPLRVHAYWKRIAVTGNKKHLEIIRDKEPSP